MNVTNLCVECFMDMGSDNPRQLCGKTQCLNKVERTEEPVRLDFPSDESRGLSEYSEIIPWRQIENTDWLKVLDLQESSKHPRSSAIEMMDRNEKIIVAWITQRMATIVRQNMNTSKNVFIKSLGQKPIEGGIVINDISVTMMDEAGFPNYDYINDTTSYIPVLSWRNVPQFTWLKVLGMREVQSKFGKSFLLNIIDRSGNDAKVWITQRMARLVREKLDFRGDKNVFIKSLGKKPYNGSCNVEFNHISLILK